MPAKSDPVPPVEFPSGTLVSEVCTEASQPLWWGESGSECGTLARLGKERMWS